MSSNDSISTGSRPAIKHAWRYSGQSNRASSGNWVSRQTSVNSRSAKVWARQISQDLFRPSGKLNLARRHPADSMLFVLAFGLAFFGLVIIYSISSGLYDGNQSMINQEMMKRVVFLLLGIVTFFVVRLLPLDLLRKYSSPIFLFGLAICLALPLLGAIHFPLATCTLGACRWYSLGVLSFQPAELLKLGTVLFMAGYLANRIAKGKINSSWTLTEVGLVMIVSLAVIVGLQKDMGTGAALLVIFIVQLIMSGMSYRRLGLILGIMMGLFVIMIIAAPHRLARIATFTKAGDSDMDYHINQAMIGLGSGGLTGRGLGQSVQAYGWLPEAVNDSIFAVIGETLGFVGTVGLIAVFAFLIIRMLKMTNYLDNIYLRLVVVGVAGWFSAHVLANTMSMIHLIPLTGITLPLVSSGGTSLLFVMASLGIVSSISRYASRQKIDYNNLTTERTSHEDFMRRRRQRWSRYSDSSSH